jgi:5'(3')-deoxyribonucleotidase
LVALDCDGVLADFTGHMLDIIAEVTGVYHEADAVTQWDFGNLLPDEGSRKRAWSLVRQPGSCGEISPVPGAGDGVAALRAAGCRIKVVTSPMSGAPTWAHERTLWLRDMFEVDARDIVFASDKAFAAGTADVLVDDSPDNVSSFPGLCVMPAAAYNALTVLDGNRVVRVDGWPAIVEATLAQLDRKLGRVA